MAGSVAVKHVWFETQLVSASGAKSLRVAAPQWELSHLDHAHDGQENCQLCHTVIRWVVVIRNVKNGVLLRIGTDCYDKLLLYLKTKKVEAVRLSSRAQYARGIRGYITKELGITGRKVLAAMTIWLDAQSELPKGIAQTLIFIKFQRCAPTLEAARDLVQYYKGNRRFPIADLLTHEEYQVALNCSHQKLLPRQVTLADLPRYRGILARWRRIVKHQWAKVIAAREARAAESKRQHVSDVEAMSQGLVLSDCTFARPLMYGNYTGRTVRMAFGYHGWSYSFLLRFPTDSIGAKVWELGVTEEDVVASCPTTARFTHDGSIESSTCLELHGDDTVAWIQQVQIARDARLVQREADANAVVENLVENFPELYVKCAFAKGLHPRGGQPQWEARVGGEKFVLAYGDIYKESNGVAYARIVRELSRNRVFLVTRLYLDMSTVPYRWYYYAGNPRFRQYVQ